MGEKAVTADELSDKFGSQLETLVYGDLGAFNMGLEGSVGAPNPDLVVAMEEEHTTSACADLEFTAGSYGIRTTARTEW